MSNIKPGTTLEVLIFREEQKVTIAISHMERGKPPETVRLHLPGFTEEPDFGMYIVSGLVKHFPKFMTADEYERLTWDEV